VLRFWYTFRVQIRARPHITVISFLIITARDFLVVSKRNLRFSDRMREPHLATHCLNRLRGKGSDQADQNTINTSLVYTMDNN
jgi:hypothetical protein